MRNLARLLDQGDADQKEGDDANDEDEDDDDFSMSISYGGYNDQY